MHTPVAPDELVAAIQAEVAAGAAWVKIIGDAPTWDADGPVPKTNAVTYDPDTLRQAVDAAHAAGARVAVHTNLPDFGLIGIGADSIEIALLVEHGLTPAQAITAAGSHARDFLGVHPAGDIVTYDDDPLQDPSVLARPAAVVVRGVRLR